MFAINAMEGLAWLLNYVGWNISNNNAFNRLVVLHGYDCVPDYETYPMAFMQ